MERRGFFHAAAFVAAIAPRVDAQLPAGFQVETAFTIGSSGNEPVSLVFPPGGTRMLVALRGGTIRVADLTTLALLPTPFAVRTVTTNGERGLLSLALDPAFASNGFVYLFEDLATSPLARIVRLTYQNDVGGNETAILGGIPQDLFHNGGKIRFGPDGFLYYALGDHFLAQPVSQDPANPRGKVHRIDEATGAAAPGNPFGNSVYSLGLRNTFGIAFSPVSGILFETEPGPFNNDELNRIPGPGANMGWPIELGPGPDPTLLDPIHVFTPSTPTPVGLDFYWGSAWPALYAGDLFVVEYTTGNLHRFVLDGAPDTRVKSHSVWTQVGLRGLEVAMGTDGNLWFASETEIRRIRFTATLPSLDLSLQGTPQVGQTIAVQAVHGDPGWWGFLVIGFSRISPIPLPWGNLLVSPDLPLGLGTFSANGVKSRLFQIPPDPTTAGGSLHLQGVEILDATTGSLSAPLSLTVLP